MKARHAASIDAQRPNGRRLDQPLPRYQVCPHCKCLVDELTGCPKHGAIDPIWSAVHNGRPPA